MSLSTTVHVGYYIFAKCSTFPFTEKCRACANEKCNHVPTTKDRFCSACGERIVLRPKVEAIKRSMSDVQYPTGEDWVEKMSAEDKAWLNQTFQFITPEWVGVDDYDDVLLVNPAETIDADDAGTYSIDPVPIMVAPTRSDIQRLLDLMKYVDHEINFGVLVQVC